jgi:hypothetical protein
MNTTAQTQIGGQDPAPAATVRVRGEKLVEMVKNFCARATCYGSPSPTTGPSPIRPQPANRLAAPIDRPLRQGGLMLAMRARGNRHAFAAATGCPRA